jgi:redox-sensitive bicupin YhaK (pirin superfamily)
VWHHGHPVGSKPLQHYRLCVALPPSEENAPAESQHIAPEDVQQEGLARVVLGQLGNAASAIRSPPGINNLHVKLKDGQGKRSVRV